MVGGAALVVVLAAGIAFFSLRSASEGDARGGGSSTVDVPPPPGDGSPSVDASPAAAGTWWRPKAGLTWQWQLSGKLDRSVDAQVYDIDGQDSSAADVAALKAAGRRVICYVNAGAFEDWRPDAKRFPKAVLGKDLDGWPGERWLDIRQWAKLEPILAARFDTCRAKGFDAVEPDNVDGYANESGFPLTAADQLTFNRRLAALAHRRGLAVGLKNDVEQAAQLEPYFDFAVNEECAQYDECGKLAVFVKAGKPVFHVEYEQESGGFCPESRRLGFSSLRKKPELDAWREVC
ncbi:endo alpha-1,4 polygalactosaminidase [Virgisporangium ochraceum]|uniref:Endo alpha-1,4 polygalactosaminidase n=1 Tax=Virgisporangium ochraceum TaxID=65505 RepID=A0A8J3ZWX8_9ACTN|nr:endo alpha-1,4 polygalactosaminidase [Virgisporangium ochraceum]